MSLKVNVARIIERTAAEGPGWRAAVWVQGCPILCPGCCNPGFLAFIDRHWVDAARLADFLVARPDIEGVSFLGGEPMAQAEALAFVAARVRERGLSVVTFTGYTLDEIETGGDSAQAELVRLSDMVIAGRYVQADYTESEAWIGSSNQTVHYLTPRYRGYDDGRATPREMNRIEVRVNERGEIRLNGFAFRGTIERLRHQLEARGLKLEGYSGDALLFHLSDDELAL